MNTTDHQPSIEPIAVIGMACRFPGGANDLEAFWRLLTEGVDASGDIPRERWDAEAFYDPLPNAPGKSYCKRASFLKGVDIFDFDAEFFGIPPIEARVLDPQQRLLLEVAWEALEHACLSLDAVHETRTGVFLGMMHDDVSKLLIRRGPFQLDSYSYTGTAYDVTGGRVSYTFDLCGPNLVVHTACSSSMIAVHLACQSLRNRECGIALAAGVNVMLNPEGMVRCCRMHAISPDGRSKTFDAGADGFGRGEGCGVVVLKPLAAAEADGDRVLAVIRATATNHDGHGSGRTGLSVPNPAAHAAMMLDAFSRAGVHPNQVSYLEAHGTGTPVGDPIEINAASRVFGHHRPHDQPLRIGSVKSNIGHLEGAAGIAGLIKTVLALRHRTLPPNLHLRQLNPAVDLAAIPAEIPVAVTPWETGGAPRLAAVNSFGMGGANAFALVEEGPSQSQTHPTVQDSGAEGADGSWLLPLSARSADALRALAGRYRDYLLERDALPRAPLGDVCHIAAARRTHHRYRLGVRGANEAELADGIGRWLDEGGVVPAPARPPGIVFVFSGHGSQWAGMGRRLMAQEPVFRAALERCDAVMRPYLDRQLIEMLYADDAAESLTKAEYVQPAIYAMQVSLSALWRSWGIEPQAVIGHSMGEVAAAYVSGALEFDEAARLMCLRSRVQGRVKGQGGMIAVGLPAHEAERLLLFVEDRVSIAVINSPRSCVLSGDRDALTRIESQLLKEGVFCRRVHIDWAAHCAQLDPYLEETRESARGIAPNETSVPIYSTVTGERIAGTSLDSQYWARNLRQPVLFSDALQSALQDGHSLFLEVSPHSLLVQPIQEGFEIAGRVGSVMPSLRRNEDERSALRATLGRLYEHGQNVNWRAIYPSGRPVDLPAYPWQRQRHWDDSITRPGPGVDMTLGERHPFLQRHLRSAADPETRFWEVDLDPRGLTYLADHKVMGGTLFPGAGYLEMAAAAARAAFGDGPVTIEDVRFEHALFLPDEDSRTLQLVFTTEGERTAFRFFTSGERGGAAPVLHASGIISGPRTVARDVISIGDVEARCRERIENRELYQAMDERGLHYGPAFQGIAWVKRRDGEAIGAVTLPDGLTGEWSRYVIHPALLDASLQVAATAMHETAMESNDTILPIGIDRVVVHRRLTSPSLRVVARSHDATASADGILRADLHILDDGGKPVIDVEGFRVRRLAGSAAARDPWSGWFYEIQWQRQVATVEEAALAANVSGPWLLFADQHGLADALRIRLEQRGERCVSVSRRATSGRLNAGRASWDPNETLAIRQLFAELNEADLVPRRIVYAWGIDGADSASTSLESLQRDRAVIFDAPLQILQAIDAAGWSATQLTIVTKGAQQTPEDEAAATFSTAALWGLARTLAFEHPELRTRRVDVDPGAGSDNVEDLLREVLMRGGGEEVALRHGSRYEARLEPVRLGTTSDNGSPVHVRADSTYLVTGGLGGLGLVTAESLADQGAGHLVLMGRSAPSAAAQDAICRMEAKGTAVTVARADLVRATEVAAALDMIARDLPPLRGVFHSAAVLDDGPLVHFTAERAARVLGPKIEGTWNLHELTHALPLDFFVLYSSVTSMLGFAGQGAYAAGNAFMDALGVYRRALGRPGLSINWGPWSEVGMAARLDESLRQRIAATGLRMISPARGRWALTKLLEDPSAPGQVGVFNGNWSVVRSSGPLASALLADAPTADDGTSVAQAGAKGSFIEALEHAGPHQRGDVVSKHVASQVARALGYPPDRELDAGVGFFDLGMDSLRAVDLRNALQKTTGLALRGMVAFEHPTIRALSQHILMQLADGAPPARRPPNASAAS